MREGILRRAPLGGAEGGRPSVGHSLSEVNFQTGARRGKKENEAKGHPQTTVSTRSADYYHSRKGPAEIL